MVALKHLFKFHTACTSKTMAIRLGWSNLNNQNWSQGFPQKYVKLQRTLSTVTHVATDTTPQTEAGYGAEHIQVLEGLEPVRTRPGMYIGSTGQKGLHHLIWEIVDNCIDEIQGGHGDTVNVEVDCDTRWVTVSDNGRGIPTERHSSTDKSALETVLTILHAGGKFGAGGYSVSGGLHGVGLSVVNALSEDLEVSVWRKRQLFRQSFSFGKPRTDMDVLPCPDDRSGTQIRFKYDAGIFAQDASIDINVVSRRLRELAFLNSNATLNFKAIREGAVVQEDKLHYKGGIAEFVKQVTDEGSTLHDCLYSHSRDGKSEVEVALQWCDTTSETIHSFVNCIRTIEGGTHVEGLKQAITRTINKLAKEKGMIKEDATSITGNHVISIKVQDPEFEGQTKGKLGNPSVRSMVLQLVSEFVEDHLRSNPEVLKTVIDKALLAQKAADAARRARELVRRKTVLSRSTLPGKLADCTNKYHESSEVFIVEGDSAGGSAKQARDRTFQAILPLRGKILNVEKADAASVLKNNELSSLIIALGLRVKGDVSDKSDGDPDAEEDFASQLRYNKIILLTDADVDGAHIRALLLTFLYRYEPRLFDRGCIYVAQPPLFKIEAGKRVIYCYDEKEKSAAVEKLGGTRHTIQRFKGLGEMMPEQLWQTTMNPESRKLVKLTNEDIVSTESTIQALMGGDSSRRKALITEAGHTVLENLDI